MTSESSRLTGPLAILPLLWFAPLPCFAQTEARLGRLFFTPEARQALDRQRRAGDQPPSGATTTGEFRIDGIVIGANTRATIWIDGRPLVEDRKTRKLLIRPEKADPGKITLELGTRPPLRTQVGARLDPATIEAIPALRSPAQDASPHTQ